MLKKDNRRNDKIRNQDSCSCCSHTFQQAKYQEEYDGGGIGRATSSSIEWRDKIFCTKCGMVREL